MTRMIVDDTLLRRSAVYAGNGKDRKDAAAEIIAESKKHSLGGLTIRDLLDEGRRG